MKKALSLLLALLLCLTLVPLTALAEGDLPFRDVPEGAWYYDAVKYVYDHDLMNGTDVDVFDPEGTVQRGQLVTILYRQDGEPWTWGSSFPDVPEGQYYTDAVAWASENDIVGGYEDGTFRPDDPVTREQFAAIIYRYASYAGRDTSAREDLSGYPDYASIEPWAVESLQWAVKEGIIGGSDGLLLPGGTATRAQAAAMIMRLCENVLAPTHGTDGNITWKLEDGTLTISGTGPMEDYEGFAWSEELNVGGSTAPWGFLPFEELVIEEGITYIGAYAFFDADITSVVIPKSVKVIGEGAFEYSDLQNVVLNDGLEIIKANAFSTGLKSVTIPASVKETEGAFWDCSASSYYILNHTDTIIEDILFDGKEHIKDIYLTGNEVDWKAQINRCADEIARLGVNIHYNYQPSNITWTLEDGTLTISGTGPMEDYEYGEAPWYPHSSEISHVVIEDGVTTIGSEAFEYCESLTGVTLPASVKEIGDYAFYQCTSITSIAIPSGVRAIGDGAFGSCSSLKSIAVDSGNAYYHSVEGILFSADMTRLHQYPAGKETEEYTIPTGVTKISNEAFSSCHHLVRVIIPPTVTKIGNFAFEYCDGLISVTIPASVTVIGEYAFDGCHNLTSATISASVAEIGQYAFSDCGSLADVYYGGTAEQWAAIAENADVPKNATIHFAGSEPASNITWKVENGTLTISGTGPMENYDLDKKAPWDLQKYDIAHVVIENGVTTIGDYAFFCCFGLKDVTIPNSVTAIGNRAFSSCLNLRGITIPASVTAIGDDPFFLCSNLETIAVESGSSAYSSVDGVLFTADMTRLVRYPLGKSAAYAIPSGVTVIGGQAFSGCKNLTGVSFPDGITEIGNSAFENCDGLTSITLPDGVTVIGFNVFFSCDSLTSVFIPASVTKIGLSPFFGCDSLTDVYYGGTAEQWAILSAYAEVPETATVHYGA